MEETLFLTLIDKYIGGKATPAEQRLVEELYRRLGDNGRNILSDEQELAMKEIMLDNIRKGIHTSRIEVSQTRSHSLRWIAYSAAASIAIMISLSLYFNPQPFKKLEIASIKVPAGRNDVEPGGNKAILTLADGSKINLDDAQNGIIAQQPGIRITKSDDGTLIYNLRASEPDKQRQLVYNKIETPKGGQFQINLPDGSKVWLNAASSLRYPAFFQGNERKVELTGEAYFEISPDKSKPFRIETDNQLVEVLGTHFNINGYRNESDIKTTLLQGSVKIRDLSNDQEKYLKPGEVALTGKDGKISIQHANTEQAISWKNGFFVFNDMELETIMRQLERWYNVDVDYSKIPKTRYNAHISRDLNLSEVLETLEITGQIKFTIEGKTIKITNN